MASAHAHAGLRRLLDAPPELVIGPATSGRTRWRSMTNRELSPLKEVAIDLEYVDSAGSPLAAHHLYGDRHRQFRHHDIWAASLLGGLFAAAPAVPASVQRSVHVRTAVCRQAARPVRRSNGK